MKCGDAKGRALHVEVTPGTQHESTADESIVRERGRGNDLIADTGHDSDAIHACAKKAGRKPVTHPHPGRRK